MKAIDRIGAYYSEGPHYLHVLRRLRAEFPDAKAVAVVPPDYPATKHHLACVDAVLETERTHYTIRDVAACRRLLRQIRARRFDVFVVMFDSHALRLLAALSGARRCLHGTMDGRLVALPGSFVAALAGVVGRLGWGHAVYAGVWLAVHLFRTRPRANEKP